VSLNRWVFKWRLKVKILLIYRPRKDERLRWPSWLTYSGRFTHLSDHPSAVGQAQDSESSLVKDQRSTAEPRNQPLEVVLVAKAIDILKARPILQLSIKLPEYQRSFPCGRDASVHKIWWK